MTEKAIIRSSAVEFFTIKFADELLVNPVFAIVNSGFAANYYFAIATLILSSVGPTASCFLLLLLAIVSNSET